MVNENRSQVLEDPFRLTPDLRDAFEYRNFQSGKAFLQHIITDSEKIVIVISGVAGVGKTTLVNNILRRRDDTELRYNLVQASQINTHGFMACVAKGLGLNSDGDDNALLEVIDQQMQSSTQSNLCTAVVIDNAHELSPEALENLGKLARTIYDHDHYTKLFLIGNERLTSLLRGSKNEAIKEQVITGWDLHGLEQDEIEGYVNHRLKNVTLGSNVEFESDVWPMIFEFSEGIPRRINRICSRLLINGMLDNKKRFDREDIKEAARHLDKEGLLELNANVAARYGFVGTTRSNNGSIKVIDSRAFHSGFGASGATLVEPAIHSPAAMAGAVASTEARPDDIGGYDGSIEDSLRQAMQQTAREETADPKIYNDDVLPDEIDEESMWATGKLLGGLLLLIATAVVVVYFGFLGDSDDKTALVLDGEGLIPRQTEDKRLSQDTVIQEDMATPATDTRIQTETGGMEDTVETQAEPEALSPDLGDDSGIASTNEAEAGTENINAQHDAAITRPDTQESAVTQTDVSDASTDVGNREIETAGSAETADTAATAASAEQPETGEAAVSRQAPADTQKRALDQQAVSAESTMTDTSSSLQQAPANDSAERSRPVQADESPAPKYSVTLLKAMVLSTVWYRELQPAVLLPSELSQCSDNGSDIFCRSQYSMRLSDTVPDVGHTGAMLQKFSGDGSFMILYRSIPAGESVVPSAVLGREQQMNCRFNEQGSIDCVQDGYRIRYHRKSYKRN